MIRIPSGTKESKNEALSRVVAMSAAKSGYDEYTVAMVFSWCLQQIADEVSKGRAVQLPGFGAFFPLPDKRPRYRDHVRRCRVRFHASVGFQQQVKLCAPPQDTIERKWRIYRTNHSAGDRVAGHGSRVFTSMDAFRQSISAQFAHARD